MQVYRGMSFIKVKFVNDVNLWRLARLDIEKDGKPRFEEFKQLNKRAEYIMNIWGHYSATIT